MVRPSRRSRSGSDSGRPSSAGASTSLDASLDPSRQARQVDELVALGVDGLTTWTLDAGLAEPAYERAVAARIPIVAFNSESPSVTTVIRQRADSEVPAEDAARYIAERVENARVLVVGGPPIPALVARTERFLEAAARAGLTIVGRDDNVGDVEDTAVPAVEGLLREQPTSTRSGASTTTPPSRRAGCSAAVGPRSGRVGCGA